MTRKTTALLSLLLINFVIGSSKLKQHLDDTDLQAHYLRQSGNDQYQFNSTIAETFAHYDAFLIGFRSAQIIPSALNCSQNVEGSIYVWNDTTTEWSDSTSLSFRDQLFDTTYWISYSLAPSTDNCFGSFIEVFVFAQEQQSKFDSLGSWLAACVQNLLSNVNSITQIQERMTAAQTSNDTIALAFWRGRLSNIVLIFDPIPVDEYNVTNPAVRRTKKYLMEGDNQPVKKQLQQWDDEDAEFIPTEPYQRNPFFNVISLTQGFAYASFVNASENFTICDGNYTVVKESFDVFTAQFGNVGNVTNMTNALNAVADMMATTYPLTYSCYFGGIEAENTFQGYVQTAGSLNSLFFNVFNSMGPLYDTVYYLRGWQRQDKIDIQTDQEMKLYWYRLGAYYGIMTSLLFVDQEVEEVIDNADITNWQPINESTDDYDDTWL